MSQREAAKRPRSEPARPKAAQRAAGERRRASARQASEGGPLQDWRAKRGGPGLARAGTTRPGEAREDAVLSALAAEGLMNNPG